MVITDLAFKCFEDIRQRPVLDLLNPFIGLLVVPLFLGFFHLHPDNVLMKNLRLIT
jgi:hypothetical protein